MWNPSAPSQCRSQGAAVRLFLGGVLCVGIREPAFVRSCVRSASPWECGDRLGDKGRRQVARMREELAAHRDGAAGASNLGVRQLKVLIADGHRLMLRVLRVSLEEAEGFEVVGEARYGSQVLPLVRKLNPELVLLGARMPEMDG